MKKINSENLWKFVNDLATNKKVKFKVFYDDNYVTEILWNRDYFEWEEGTFTSEGFFNPLYDFIVIEEDNDKLEKIPYEFNLGYINTNDKDLVIKEMNKTINGIYVDMNKVIDHINKIEERLDER